MIYPEDFASRHMCKTATKTAIAHGTIQIPLAVNAAGAGAVFIFPGNGPVASFALAYTDVSFDPASGAQAVAGKAYPGPLASVTS